MDFSKRHREDELMDDIAISSDKLKLIYADIDRANAFLGGNNGLVKAVENLILEYPKKKFTLLDIGCGNGEILRILCIYFRAKNVDVLMIGIDLNEKAITLAEESSKDFPEITYLKADVLEEGIELPQADLVISTLTMHHIREESIPRFLKQLDKMANIAIVINDLQRSRLAHTLFKFFSFIFIKTKEAKNDGLVSIRSGFTKKELLKYSLDLPQYDHIVQRQWAFRYVWTLRIKRPIIND